MNGIWLSIFLGLIQGATEFLPISSSGHLKAMKELMGVEAEEAGLAFDVVLHLATLLAVLIYFRRDLIRLAVSADRFPVLILLVVGTIPAAAIGLACSTWRENISPGYVVLGWTLSGTYLLLSRGRGGDRSYRQLSIWRAVLVGGSQGIAAALPGFSRSGASIASGLWLGLKREEAYRFSFLLAIPLMLGAGLLKGRELIETGPLLAVPGGWPGLILALVAAFVVGLLAIHLLFRVMVRNRFHLFGWYNLLAAGAFAIYLVTR